MTIQWKFKKIDQDGKNILYQAYLRNNLTGKYIYLTDVLSDTNKRSDLIKLSIYYLDLCIQKGNKQ